MRRLVVTGLLTATTAVGCQWWGGPSSRDAQVVVAPKLETPPPPPVRADDISPLNAYEKARQLNDELDYDLSHEPGEAESKP